MIRKYNITDVDKQYDRINKLADNGKLTAEMKTTFHRIRSIRNDCMHYDDNFKNLILRSLKYNKSKRPQNGDEFFKELERIIEQE